ncbi:MAG TPA: PDZ domain-containing protein [Terriglobia bacterium]|nr:PDZ domain-containing protein [Terriglobia bacterium]
MIPKSRASVIFCLLLVAIIPAVAGAGQAERGYFGVGLTDPPPGAPLGAMLARVDPDGPAARAGLRPGDLIRTVNGQNVPDAVTLQNYVFAMHPGVVLTFDVLRSTYSGVSSNRVSVTLGFVPGESPSPSPRGAARTAPPGPSAPPAEPPMAAASAAGVSFVVYHDPAENAFTDAVPAGWRVGGRLVRYGPISIAPFVQAMMPDGSVFVQLGDWHIKDFADMPGWPEGHLYTPGTNVEYIRRLQSAEQYTRDYALTFQKQLGCENPTVTNSQPYPTSPGSATVQGASIATHYIDFTCQRGGQTYIGRVAATVQNYRLPMSMGWNVTFLEGMLARKDRAPIGFAVWDKLRTSWAFDSNWSTRQALAARQATRGSLAALNQTLQQAQDFDKHVINSTVTVRDPATGAKWDVGMGAAPFYFTDGTGHFYNSYDPTPKPGYYAGTPLPH